MVLLRHIRRFLRRRELMDLEEEHKQNVMMDRCIGKMLKEIENEDRRSKTGN